MEKKIPLWAITWQSNALYKKRPVYTLYNTSIGKGKMKKQINEMWKHKKEKMFTFIFCLNTHTCIYFDDVAGRAKTFEQRDRISHMNRCAAVIKNRTS